MKNGITKSKLKQAPLSTIERVIKVNKENNVEKGFPNIILSDFRRDAGELADIHSFNKEFLGRTIGDLQKDCYEAVWGSKAGEWNCRYHEIVLLVGMKGGKNFWSEGDLAYACYFISMLKDPHDYFSKITKRLIPFPCDTNFDIVNVSSVDKFQASRTFFERAKNVLKSTIDPISKENWFEKYINIDLRDRFGDFTKQAVVFPVKKLGHGGIRLFSFSSRPASPEGLHIFRFYADELSRAETFGKYKRAKASIDLGLFNTAASFPSKVGKVISWSYPNASKYDIIYERYLLSKESDCIYGIMAATHEFNPAMTKSMLEDKYQQLGEDALRVYECIKPELNRRGKKKTAEFNPG